ncbi:MAG: hypothetical protein IPI07_18685 [Flavobacteriales bacterium]|nr:hypothetical protein [Flavobacteriales bacterium]
MASARRSRPVLMQFIATRHHPFSGYLGVSGGAIALSYFLSEQFGHCYKAMQVMATDPDFVKMSRVMSESGYMTSTRSVSPRKWCPVWQRPCTPQWVEGNWSSY